MYFLLNHVHLFGAEYVKPLMAKLDQLATVV
jgi:fructosamine-3-kinase